MGKLKIEDLDKIAESVRRKISLREGAGKVKITVHMGTCGIAAGARNVMATFLNQIETHNAHDIIVVTSGCAGLCSKEPMATIEYENQAPVKYIELNEEKVKKIFAEHVLKGKIVTEYALSIGSERIQ